MLEYYLTETNVDGIKVIVKIHNTKEPICLQCRTPININEIAEMIHNDNGFARFKKEVDRQKRLHQLIQKAREKKIDIDSYCEDYWRNWSSLVFENYSSFLNYICNGCGRDWKIEFDAKNLPPINGLSLEEILELDVDDRKTLSILCLRKFGKTFRQIREEDRHEALKILSTYFSRRVV